MAAVITTSSSALAKTNINSAISTSAIGVPAVGTPINTNTLTALQNAINKLSTYVNKVNNCGNCKAYTIKSTSCQSTKCQATSCQKCQACQYCQTCQSSPYYNYSVYSQYSQSL